MRRGWITLAVIAAGCGLFAVIAAWFGLFIEGPHAVIASPGVADVDALISYYERKLLPRGDRIGRAESVQLKRDSLRWTDDVFEHLASGVPHPQVIAYVSERILDPSFRPLFIQAIREESTLAASATELARAASETKTMWEDADTIRYFNKLSNEEKAKLQRNAAVPERIENLRRWMKSIFVHLAKLEREGSTTRRKVYKLVKDDLAQQYYGATDALLDSFDLSDAMRDAYLQGLTEKPFKENPTLAAQMERVKAAFKAIRGKKANFPYSALRFEQTPMEWLAHDVRLNEFLDAVINLDSETFQLFSMRVVKQDEFLAKDLDGLYDIRGSLERSRLFADGGRRALSLEIMIDLADITLSAHQYMDSLELKQDGTWTPVSWNGYSSLQLATLKRTTERFKQYRDAWLRDRSQSPLYAAIEIDDDGKRTWHVGGWLLWDWLTSADIEYFRAQGRIVSVRGKLWLVPEGQRGTQFASVPELLHAIRNVKEISLALDLNGAWAQAQEAWDKLNPAEKAYSAGNWAFQHDEVNDAEQSYSRAIELEPLAIYHLSRGNARLALMHYNDATQDYDRAIQLQPTYAPSYLARGTLAALLGTLSAAESDFKAAVRLQPDNEFYHSRLAEVLRDEDKGHEIIEVYRRAFVQDNSRPWALQGLLSGLFAEKRFDETLDLVSNNLRRGVYVSWLYYYAARVDETRNNPNAALQSYREAIAHDSDDLIPIETYFKLASLERNTRLTADCDTHLQEYQRRLGQPEYDKKWCYK